MNIQNSIATKSRCRHSFQQLIRVPLVMLILLAAAVMGAGSPAALAGGDSERRSCIPEGEGLSVQDGVEMFRRQGHVPRPAGKIQKPGDMVGGIMFMGKPGHWLYLTHVEMMHDPKRQAVAFSLLEGVTPDGRRIRNDKTRELSRAGFRPVENWNDLGEVSFGGPQGRQMTGTLNVEVSPDGLLTQTGGPSSCRVTLGGDCLDTFCFAVGANCRFNAVRFDCNCRGVGFCFTQPALNCAGTCAADESCRAGFRNPGAVSCGCVPGDGPVEEEGQN